MARWLLKTEPSEYGFDDLLRDRRTTWDGVANAVAVRNVRAMRKGDPVLVYHTGDERAAVGTARVTKDAYPDPNDPAGKVAVVDLKPLQRLPRPVTLAAIKADPAFAGWELLRIGRLSVVPVPDAMWSRIMELAAADEGEDGG